MPRFSRKRSASTKKNGKRRRRTMSSVRSRKSRSAKTTRTRKRQSIVRSFRKGKRGFGRRVRRGGSAKALLAKFQRRATGGRRGPLDQLVSTAPTAAFTIDPNSSSTSIHALWGWGSDIALMLTNIRAEAPSTLLGGTVLMQPQLVVYGYATFDICPAGNSPIAYELILATRPGKLTGTSTLATTGTNFTAAWATSYDTRPTSFENFPDTSLLENVSYWSSANAAWRPTRRITGRAEVGRPRRYVFKFKTRRFDFQEYSQGTFLTQGQVSGKTFGLFTKTRAIPGQVCGTLSAVNQPILTELGTPYMMKTRSYYFYRWEAGNNRPSVYGSNLGTNEAVDEDALSWIGVPALRAQRQSTSEDVTGGFANWGATDAQAHHEAILNPFVACTGSAEPYIPDVHVV